MQESYALWSLLTEPGDSLAGYLRTTFGINLAIEYVSSSISAQELIKKFPEDGFRAPGFENTLQENLDCYRRRLRTANPVAALEVIAKLGGFLLTEQDDDWPIRIDDLGNSAPGSLWCLGDRSLLNSSHSLSVIGSRLASDYGLDLAKDMVRFAVAENWTVVSGGALGIDAMAAVGAMEHGGKTVAVMAGGLDRLYPKQNLDLFRMIEASGLLVSEMAPGVAPSRWRFLQRNRLIAALGDATLVVEAGFRSGSINTAHHAGELGRPVGAVPGRIDSVRSAGCHRLIREGRAELIATPSHLRELMGEKVIEAQHFKNLQSEQIRALDALGAEPMNLEAVATSAGLTLFEAETALSTLNQMQLVVTNKHGWAKP